MATPKKPGMLDPLRNRVRRAQLIVGVGFLAYVAGAILASSVVFRLNARVESPALGTVLAEMWLFTTLPGLFYVAARFIELRPWPSAAGAAATGEVFRFALDFVSTGWDWLERGVLAHLLRLLVVAGGVFFTQYVIRLARAHAGAAEAEAQKTAESKKGEYDEFAKEAERIAAKTEAKESAAESSESARANATEPSPTPDGQPDPYVVLGIRRDAPLDDAKRAYREKIAQYHPDKVAHLGPKLREVAEAEARSINNAWEKLEKDLGPRDP
jgi:hypothetical protein